jgi:hypothetical protein
MVASLPAGAALPDLHAWNVHASPDGITVRGVSASGATKVTYIVLPPSGGETTVAIRNADGVTYRAGDVLGAIAADLPDDGSATTAVATPRTAPQGIIAQPVPIVDDCVSASEATARRAATDARYCRNNVIGVLVTCTALLASYVGLCHLLY